MLNVFAPAAVLCVTAASFLGASDSVAQATIRDVSPSLATPPVVDVRATGARNTASAVTPSFSGPVLSGAAAPPPTHNVAYQIQQLQQEILTLRGLLEEQSFELKRLKQQRLDDYLDLDKRLSGVTSRLSQKAPQEQVSNTKTITSTKTVAPANKALPADEKSLYRQAIDKLLHAQDYEGAQQGFKNYLQTYPNGTYVPNIYYWQGQIDLSKGDKASAIKMFSSLIQQYGNHAKAADAKFKLASIYLEQGKKQAAKPLLEEVVANNTDVSRLAKTILNAHFK